MLKGTHAVRQRLAGCRDLSRGRGRQLTDESAYSSMGRKPSVLQAHAEIDGKKKEYDSTEITWRRFTARARSSRPTRRPDC